MDEENIVALDVGQDFKSRWLNAPEIVRQTLLDDLTRIGDLLNVQTDIAHWIDQDRRAQQISQLKIEQAHADLKAELIEAARQRKQQALEQMLADKRAQQQAYAKQLQQDEVQQFQQQTLLLNTLREKIDAETQAYSQRFSKVAITTLSHEAQTMPSAQEIRFQHSEQEIANVRLRLELESEQIIQQALSDLKENLQQAAQEEIRFILDKLNN